MLGWHDGLKSEMNADRKMIHPITCHASFFFFFSNASTLFQALSNELSKLL